MTAPPNPMNVHFLDHPLRIWAAACGTAAATFAVLFIARWLVTSWLAARAQKTASLWDDLIVDAARRTSIAFYAAIALWAGCRWLDLPDAWQLVLTTGVAVVCLLQAGLWGNSIVRFVVMAIIDRREGGSDASQKTARNMVLFLARGVIWGVVGLSLLNQFGFSPTAVFTGLGVFGLALTLATQSIVGDIFASMSILLDKPFLLGDFIMVDDIAGIVERIGIKTTRLRSLSGENLVMSNADLTKSRIRNFRSMPTRRVLFRFSVAHDTPISRLAPISEALRHIIEGQAMARFDRAELMSFADNGLTFEVVYYVLEASYATYTAVQQRINLALLDHLAAASVRLGVQARRHEAATHLAGDHHPA